MDMESTKVEAFKRPEPGALLLPRYSTCTVHLTFPPQNVQRHLSGELAYAGAVAYELAVCHAAGAGVGQSHIDCADWGFHGAPVRACHTSDG